MNDLVGTEIAKLAKGQKVGEGLQLYAGRVMPNTFGEVIQFAQMMCKAGTAIPKHYRDNPGACLSIIQRSMAWQMDPWAVATKTYLVKDGDTIAYEAQLIAAVVKKWAPLVEKVIPYKFTGDGGELECSILVHHIETGEEIVYVSPKQKTIKTQNSPLWASDPQQQLAYYSIRALCRRHFPEILLGVYDREEVLAMRDITPEKRVDNFLEDEPAGDVQPTPQPPAAAGPVLDRAGPANLETSSQPVDDEQGADGQSKGESGAPATVGPSASVTTGSRREAAEAERRAAETEAMNRELEGEEPDPFDQPADEPETPIETITPERIAENMLKSIAAAYDRAGVEALQGRWKADIVNLPGGLAARVRLALQERIKALEGEEF